MVVLDCVCRELVFLGTSTCDADVDVVRHEIGHILQAQTIEFLSFYLVVGIIGLISVWTNGFGRGFGNY